MEMLGAEDHIQLRWQRLELSLKLGLHLLAKGQRC